MISGRTCWSSALQWDMADRNFGNNHVYTFKDLPRSLYWLLVATAQRYPNNVALVDDAGTKTSYAELLAKVDAFGAYLVQQGVQPGDCVALLMRARLEFVVALLASSRAGALCVPLPTKCRPPEIAQLIHTASPKLLIADEQFQSCAQFADGTMPSVMVVGKAHEYAFSRLQGASVEPCGSYDDPAVMLFTSGTTSQPKGVVLKNYQLCHAALVYARLMGTTPHDRCLIPIPIYHVTGLVALLLHFLAAGATTYLHRTFDAERVLATIKSECITYMHGSPTSLAALLPYQEDYPQLPSVRAILSGSSYEPVATMRAFHDWMPQAVFKVVYGMTETASPALLFPYDSATTIFTGATGKPVPGVDVKIVSRTGQEVLPGQIGELFVRGACVCDHYFQHAAPGPNSEGWLATGDSAWCNEEGMVWIVGRRNDMVNCGGEKVWCSPLEEVLCELPFVSQSCVTGIPDELYGEVPVAALVPSPGCAPTCDDVRAALKERVAQFKIPTHIVLVNAIPQTRADKPDRARVRALVLAALGREEQEVPTWQAQNSRLSL